MLNHPESYTEAGKRAAIAVNQGDIERANVERRHFLQMVALEDLDDQQTAGALYRVAYKENRRAPL